MNYKKNIVRRQGLNPGPRTCEAVAVPLDQQHLIEGKSYLRLTYQSRVYKRIGERIEDVMLWNVITSDERNGLPR